MDTEEKKIDITNFDEGPAAIIRYMDYLPPDDNMRMGILMAFMNQVMGI